MSEEEFFFKEKPVRAIIHIYEYGETTSTEIHNDIETTYSHTVKIVDRLKEFNLVEMEKRGRKKFITLTDKGLKIGEELTKVFNLVKKE